METQRTSIRRTGEVTNITAETFRHWVNRANVDTGDRPGVSTLERGEFRAPRMESAELKRVNEILKAALEYSRPGIWAPY